jgi:hypothetical protein
MKTSNFTTTVVVDKTPLEAFNAINNVRGWWSEEIEGNTEKLNDEFAYHYEDVHKCRIKLTEVIPAEKVVWLVLENYFKFTTDAEEWTGNRMVFDIAEKDGKTEIQFTQEGLVPEYECYEACKNGWTHYIQDSLYNLISTGEGKPNRTGKPQTEDEKKLTDNQ